MVGETGFEPATLCSQITRLLFGFNGVCQVSPYVPPYSTQWVSAPVTNRRGAFFTKKGDGPKRTAAGGRSLMFNYLYKFLNVQHSSASCKRSLRRSAACPNRGAGRWQLSR